MNQAVSTSLRSIRSFVIREGRFTAAQKKAFDQYWPLYGIAESKAEIKFDQYFEQSQPVVLDVGFGNGDSLISLATQRQDLNFVGVEVYRPGIGNVLNKLHQLQIENVRVINKDVFELLQNHLPNNCLAGLMIWFPDPWPKKRHHKRRLIQQEFLQHVARTLIPNGTLHLASDWQPYVEWMQDEVEKTSLFNSIEQNLLGLTRPATRFEQRGVRLGQRPTDLFYQIK